MLKLPKGRNHPFRLIYKNFLKLKGIIKSGQPSNIIIDVLIPVIEKDLDLLPFVINCAKKNIMNPIDNFFIVGKKGVIEDICLKLKCIFLDEDIVMPIKKSDIVYKNNEWFRSGWIFQQLIKLNADELILSKNSYVLILDADTCLTSRQSVVLKGGQIILNFVDEYHFPYSSFTQLTELKKRFYLSFISHYMVFDKTILKNMKQDIESYSGKDWMRAIIDMIDGNESSFFSEYEMYGNYVYYKHRKNIHLEYWNNKSFKRELANNEMIEKNANQFKSISFHKYE